MKKIAVAVLAAVCILGASGCVPEHYATRAQGTPQDSLVVLRQEDVIALTKAGISNDVIVRMINTTGSTFRLRTPDVIALADSGVADTVIHAMLLADESSRKEDRPTVYRTYPYDYYWWGGYPYYDPWFWPSYYWAPRAYYGVRVFGGFHGHGRHR